MSKDNTGGTWVFSCDICGDELETHEMEFAAALRVKTNRKWSSRKDRESKEWADVCFGCKKVGYCNGVR